MSVFIVIHDDEYMDTGVKYIRSVHATMEKAKAAIPRKKTRNLDAHDWHCCSVEEWEVEP